MRIAGLNGTLGVLMSSMEPNAAFWGQLRTLACFELVGAQVDLYGDFEVQWRIQIQWQLRTLF